MSYRLRVDEWANTSLLWQKTITTLLHQFVPPKSRVMDYGGNLGALYELAKKKLPVEQISKYDLIEQYETAREAQFWYKGNPVVTAMTPRELEGSVSPSYDVIFMVHSLGHLPNPRRILHRLLKDNPDAKFIFVVPNKWHTWLRTFENWIKGYKSDPTIKWIYGKSGWEDLIEMAGLKLEQSYYVGKRAYGCPKTKEWVVLVGAGS